MKRRYLILSALVLLSFVITAIFLCFLPAQVPMHYNAAGEMDRMGSKYENLIFPGIALLLGLLLGGTARGSGKKGEVRNEKVLLLTGIAVLFFFNLLEFFLLRQALLYRPQAAPSGDLWKLFSVLLGVLLIFLGNLMPKAAPNGVFGLRTSWSMKTKLRWQKSQRFGGALSVFFGFLFLLLSFFLSANACLTAMLALLGIWLIVSLLGSWLICRKLPEVES